MVGQLAIPTNPVLSEAVALILSKVRRMKDPKVLFPFFLYNFGFLILLVS